MKTIPPVKKHNGQSQKGKGKGKKNEIKVSK